MDIACNLLRVARDLALSPLCEGQDFLCALTQEDAVLGERDAARTADYELFAEHFLHLAQLARECGL